MPASRSTGARFTLPELPRLTLPTAYAALHRGAAHAARSVWGDRGARVGLAARGLVYFVLAYLVARIALGGLGGNSPKHAASGPGIAQTLAAQTGGRLALSLLAVGLILFALFSLLDAVLHHDDESPGAKRWGDRALSAWGFLLYGAFAAYCVHTALSAGAADQTAAQSERQQTEWSAVVLGWPVGWLWLGGLGLSLLVIAGFLVSRCFRLSFLVRLCREEMSPRIWRIATYLGAVGYLARAGLFALVGAFVLAAAIENNPGEGNGVDGSARTLAASGYGPYLLWSLAVGLAGYALYMFLEARYRRV